MFGVTNPFAIPNPLSFAKKTQTVFCDTDVGKIASQVISFQENIMLMDRKDSDAATIGKNVSCLEQFSVWFVGHIDPKKIKGLTGANRARVVFHKYFTSQLSKSVSCTDRA